MPRTQPNEDQAIVLHKTGPQRGRHWKSFKKVEEHAKAIEEAQAIVRKTTSEQILLIGQKLAEAQKRLARFGEGTFIRWCELRLKLRKTTVYKWLRVADRFGDRPQCVQSIAPSALYVLSEPSAPAEARRKAIKQAERGEVVSHKDARRLIAASPASKSPAPSKRTYDDLQDEMRFCWLRLVELRTKAKLEDLRLFHVWRRDNPAAWLDPIDGFVGLEYVRPPDDEGEDANYINPSDRARERTLGCAADRARWAKLRMID